MELKHTCWLSPCQNQKLLSRETALLKTGQHGNMVKEIYNSVGHLFNKMTDVKKTLLLFLFTYTIKLVTNKMFSAFSNSLNYATVS